MSEGKYFTRYNSPNIVIVPTNSLSDDPRQKPESEADSTICSSTNDTNKSIPILTQGTTSNSESCKDPNSYASMTATSKSWASSYLQSIGLSNAYEKSILNRRGKMNTSQDSGMFLCQEPPSTVGGPHQYANINTQTATPSINYAFGQSRSTLGNDTTFHNYNNIASNNEVMPATSYPGCYENNNYYYGPTMNAVESGCCSTCYGTVENQPNTYLNTYGQPSNVVNNRSSTLRYYDPNATTTLAPVVNLPYSESFSFINNNTQTIKYFGHPVNIPDNNTCTSITPCENKRCSTPLFDENVLTPQLDTCINRNSSVTEITDIKTCNMENKKLSSVSDCAIEEKTCKCTCSKRNPDAHNKQNTEQQINAEKELEQMSSVQANEKAFRDFLRKLKIDRPSEKEKKLASTLSKSPSKSKRVKKSKTKSKERSSVQENEKAFRKLLQQLKMERKRGTEKNENKEVISKSPSFKDTKSSHEEAITRLENKSSKDSKQKEERPKFIKTKYVDEQEPEYKPIKKARLESKYELEKYSKTKIVTTKYVDDQEPDYNPKKSRADGYENKRLSITKSKSTKYLAEREYECKPMKKVKNDSDYELKTFSNPKTIPTKYIDKQEPEYKPVKKQSNESDYELKKYSNSKTSSTKYLDEREFECKPMKKAKNDNDYELKRFSNPRTIPTKYVDKQEPEYKPVTTKQSNESDYELKKYSNTKTISTKYVGDNNLEYKQIKKTRIDSSSELTKHSTKKYDPKNLKVKRLRDELDPSDKLCKKYDSDYKIRTYKTEATKYYKYRTDNCEDTHKQTPVKSMVKISKSREFKKSPLYKIVDKEDLRDKLSRKLPIKNKERKEEISKRKEESNDNLIITVNNNISENKISPLNNTDNMKTKTESCKKINLVINIVYKQPGSRSESDKSDSDSPQAHADLSFLDDFNVDEIVASLNKTEKINTHQNAQSDVSYIATSGEERTKKTDISNVLIKRENSEISKAKIILEKGDLLNNLLSQEANLLDNLRTIHKEIQSEKRSCVDNEQHKLGTESQSGLPQKDNKCSADALLKTNVKNETVVNKSINENISPEESKESGINNSSPSTNTCLSPLSVFMDQLNKIGHIKDFSDPINYALFEDETMIFIENNMNSYDHNITSSGEEDKRRQSELLKILEGSKDDKTEAIQTQSNSMSQTSYALDKVSNEVNSNDDNIVSFDEEVKRMQSELLKILEDTKEDEKEVIKKQNNSMPQTAHVIDKMSNELTIIDLSSDSSNDSYKTKPYKEKSLDDVFIVEEKSGKNLIDTIDLTIAENVGNQISTESLETAEDISSKRMLAKQVKSQGTGVCFDNNASKNTETGAVTKTVTAIRDAIGPLKTSETLNNGIDKLKVDALDTAGNVKDREVSNMQEVIKQSPIYSQPSEKSISISSEEESSASRMFNKDCKKHQEKENSACVTNSENIANCDADKEKHENDNNNVKLKNDVIMELPRKNINTIKEIVSEVAINTKIEATVMPQAEVCGKNVKMLSADMKFENSVPKTSIEDCNTVQITEKDVNKTISDIAICNKQIGKDGIGKNAQIIETKTKVNIDEIKKPVDEDKSPKAIVRNKTEASSPKTMPSSATRINTVSPTIKKDKSNLKVVDVKVEHGNTTLPIVSKDKLMHKIAGKIEQEMFNCFNQKYNSQGLIHSGTYSKIFHFSSFSGRYYAVKSYNEWQSIFKYAEKKDMLFAMQEGLMRHNYGSVFIINSFSVQGHLCLLMDYYPKNLTQAMEENEKPFHIKAVQHLASQLVSAVMLLKSHDVVHLDIKPTHILLNHKNNILKLCGFDAARYINRIPMLPNLGTVNYRPPEVIIGYKIGFDVDVWATAVVMYEMATHIKLFPGTDNNDILFKQMCTLGAVPVEMLQRSRFNNVHFTGSSFKRVRPKNQNKINIITKFYKTKRLETTIIHAYNANWRSNATHQELIEDIEKIMSFTALLREMLEVDPGNRMPIQFVNSHPFITKK